MYFALSFNEHTHCGALILHIAGFQIIHRYLLFGTASQVLRGYCTPNSKSSNFFLKNKYKHPGTNYLRNSQLAL